MTNDRKKIVDLVDGLNAMMARNTYQKSSEDVKQSMIFAFLEGYKTAVNKKSSSRKKK